MATATMPMPAVSKARNGTAPHAHASTDEAPTAQLITVTPEMARAWLASAHPNRPVSRARVKTIARAIVAGFWQLNGQTLVLWPEFRLLDGKHRCMAIVEAGRSVQTFVVCSIDPQCFLSMDQGKKRSAADLLQTAGHKQASTLSSALRWCWRLEHAQMLSPTIALLDVELPRYLDEHKMIISSLSWGLMLKTIIPAGVGSALHMMMHGKDPALASTLFKGLASGLELRADDAIYAVRERYIHQPRALHHVGVVERCAAIVRCWQTMRTGRPMPSGKWAGTSSMFPSIE